MTDLIGGIQYVTLSDDEARRRGTQKSILERKAYPAFEIVIEINSQNSWTVHEDVTYSVDLLLRNNSQTGQIRQFSLVEKLQIKCQKDPTYSNLLLKNKIGLNETLIITEKSWIEINKFRSNKLLQIPSKSLIIYSYSISKNFLKEVFSRLSIKFVLTSDIKKANLIIGLKKHLRQNFQLKELAKRKKIPIYSLTQLSIYEITKFFKSFN